jgi:histone acetyltransferase HTATIP
VQKPLPSGGIEERNAEILSIRDKPKSAFAPPPTPGTVVDARDDVEYYVHYSEFNKRLDEWVGGSRLVLCRDL